VPGAQPDEKTEKGYKTILIAMCDGATNYLPAIMVSSLTICHF